MDKKTVKETSNILIKLNPKKLEDKKIRRIKVTLEYFLK